MKTIILFFGFGMMFVMLINFIPAVIVKNVLYQEDFNYCEDDPPLYCLDINYWGVNLSDAGSKVKAENGVMNISSGNGYAHTGASAFLKNYNKTQNYTIEFTYQDQRLTTTKAGNDGFYITNETIFRDVYYNGATNGIFIRFGEGCTVGTTEGSIGVYFDSQTTWHCDWATTYATNTSIGLSTKTNLTDGNWHSVKINFNGTSGYLEIYINGSQVLTTTISSTNLSSLTSNVKFDFHQSHYPYSTTFEGFSVDDFSLSNWTNTEYNNPLVTLYYPLNNSISSNSTVNFTCSAGDDTGIKNVSLWTNFTGFWTSTSSNTSGLNNTNYTFSIGLNNYVYTSNFSTTQATSSYGVSYITGNGTDFWLCDSSSIFIYHVNLTGGNITDGFKPNEMETLQSCKYFKNATGTYIVAFDVYQSGYFYNLTGTKMTDTCTFSEINSIYDATINGTNIIIYDGDTGNIVVYNLTCGYVFNKSIGTGWKGITNNGSYFLMSGQEVGYNTIFNSTFSSIRNFTLSPSFTGTYGVFSPAETIPDKFNKLYYSVPIGRITNHYSIGFNEDYIWNCYVCDTAPLQSNCGFANSNFTYYDRCWDYNSGARLLSIPANCWFKQGGLFKI